MLPQFPGLDGGKLGHWGNQSDANWMDLRWNATDLGNVLSGVFRGAGVTVPKGVCVRLGDRGELSACFNPMTLCYEAVWSGGFVRFSAVRHGLMEGLILDGTPLPRPEGKTPEKPFVYHGFYRHGNRIVFAYRIGDVELLDAPWVEDGHFTRIVAPADKHPLAHLTRGGGPARWPQILTTRGTIGHQGAYAIDTIEPPFQNPWNALLFFSDHDFLPDGTAMVSTIQGDVWRVEGLDDTLQNVRWKRYASGLHQALGLVVAEGKVYVLGRDQITRFARPGRRRRGRLLRVFQQCLRDLARRPRFHLRTPARFVRPLLHRVGQAGPVADLGRRPIDPGDRDRLPQPGRPGARSRRHADGPGLRGGMDAGLDGP